MKNYLIKGMHQITSDKWWEGSDRSKEGDLFELYGKMNELGKVTFKQFLQGDWELINLVSEADDVCHIFRQQFLAIYDIWKQEPCNILYCGADTQMIRSTEVFGRYDTFRLFNYTDPKTNGPVAHYLNADVRYYPSTMSQEIWDWALPQVKTCTEWGIDQVLYNYMVWLQGVGHKEVIDPKMAYQGFMFPCNEAGKTLSDEWNGCNIEHANLIHWHGSRGAEQKLAMMQHINNQLGILETTERAIVERTINVSHIK